MKDLTYNGTTRWVVENIPHLRNQLKRHRILDPFDFVDSVSM